MKTIILGLLVFLITPSLCLATESSAYDRVIAKNELVCGVIPWAPYKEFDPNTGEWKGFAIELYRKAFATLDLKVTFKEVVLGTQVQDLNSGAVDAICDEGRWTLSAGKFAEFSDPVYASIVYAYARKGDARFKSRADLNKPDVLFTGIDGDLSSDLVTRLFPQAKLATMPGMTDVSQLYLNIATKKADVVIADVGSFAVFEKNNPNQLVRLFSDKPLGIYKTVISVKKGDVKMLGLVNQAVDNALAFGITDEVLDGFDPEHQKLGRVRSRFTLEK
jgi:ABC-type amino acid transport substrate-binding protein